MRILHLTNIIGEHKGGGVHEVVSNLYKNQKRLHHDPHIWYPGEYEDANSIREDDNIVPLSTFGDSKYGLLKNIFYPIPNKVEYDIIHQHGIWMPMSIFSKKLRKKSQIQGVIQPHGYLEPFRLNISKYKKFLAYNLFEKSNLRSANALVACSYDEAWKLKKLFPKKDIAVIPNGVSSDFFNAKNQNNSLKMKLNMLFLSQIIPIKGLERLFYVIAAIGVKKFTNWELTIAGYEDKNHTTFLKNLSKELGLSNFISFVGSKIGEEKVKAFDNADLFILPTYNENYGIVVAEALARKVPVLTTQGAPWSELNTNNCGFWVENNEEGIKKGLLKVLEMNRSDLKNMGIKGRALIKEKYLWSKTTLKTIELYEWVLNKGTKPEFFI